TESLGSFVQAKTVSVLGSPPYMSPEQWSNGDVDHRADIYGLGVMLYEMLTGSLPFDGDSIPAIVYQHLSVAPPSFASHGVLLPPSVEAVVMEAMQKEREARPDSVEEMLAQLEDALGGAGVSATVRFDANSFPSGLLESDAKTVSDDGQSGGLTMTQKKRLHSYFDIPTRDNLAADKKLAQEFLQAQDRAEEAKEQVGEADRLVNEFAEAQKLAEEAQQRAAQAQKRIEEDVRRRVEAEMESKLVAEQQARKKAEAEARLLTEEAEARRKAEERANQLAAAALQAQQIAEAERKKADKEAHQRELEESVRRQAEIDAQKLTEQVAESKRNTKKRNGKPNTKPVCGSKRKPNDKKSKIKLSSTPKAKPNAAVLPKPKPSNKFRNKPIVMRTRLMPRTSESKKPDGWRKVKSANANRRKPRSFAPNRKRSDWRRRLSKFKGASRKSRTAKVLISAPAI
ncbi:MAG: protein kinase, partial [Pyrinomonadaceae bacterium]|nr:protein kinase [Pyrinomonadaceae bacterium]